jgi:ribonucleoside-diphosphate reductase alpha chain
MRDAKAGAWWEQHPEFALANNSAVYEEKPSVGQFFEEWLGLYRSRSGERGIYYRKGIRDKIKKLGKRDETQIVGTNPCAEIALRSGGLCNLTEVVARAGDTEASLIRKIKIASFLGTVQSTFTDFRYVRSLWKKNAEEERLLGVSLTGIYDCPLLNNPKDEQLPFRLEMLRKIANDENETWAGRLGINRAASVTTVKPSGTVSQLVDSASGIHPRHARHYIRRIRQDNKDPLTQFLKDKGIPNEPCVLKPESTTVFSFPMAAPEGGVVREQVDALAHLELWALFNRHWSDHQVSVTINVEEHEWPRVGAWVYDKFDELSGISFLPYDGGTYRQAPYEEVSESVYTDALKNMPKDIDWTGLSAYEKEDTTEGTQTLACVAGYCEL